MTTPSASAKIWRLGSAAVVLPFALDPLGNLPNAVALAVILIAALQAFSPEKTVDTSNVILLALAGIIVVIAALEILNPNVPSLTVGLIGFRKTATFVLGIVIGLGWRGSRAQGLRLTWWCIFASASASLVTHLYFPSVEQSISRAAGKYTAMIAGVERMQGLLAGPFHVSMAGVFLTLTALTPSLVVRQRWMRPVAAFVGLACVYYSQVRSGLVALAIGAIVVIFLTRSAKQWASRIIVAVGLGVLGIIYINPLTEYATRFTALSTLIRGNYSQDQRLEARYTSWSQGWDLIERSPFIGFGSGSAGDTLGAYFGGGVNVSTHSIFLKYAVEGGMFQGLLFALLCVSLVLAVRPSRDPTSFGLAAGVTFLVFGLVGSATDAIPISFGLAVIWGLCARKEPTDADGTSASASSLRQHSEESL